MTQRPDYPTASPYVMTDQPDAVMAFLEAVFDATPVTRPWRRPDGSFQHAALRIGDSIVMLGGVGPGEGMRGFVHIYVDDVDAVFAKALAAGAEAVREPTDERYGDRAGGVRDAAGNLWWIASFREHVAPDEFERRAREDP